MSANDMQVAGTHYKTTYQHWDFCLEALDNRYLEGQVTKYVARWRKKNGLQDLEKAMHFLDKLREVYGTGLYAPAAKGRGLAQGVLVTACVRCFIAANNLDHEESSVMKYIAHYHTDSGLLLVKEAIARLITEAKAMEPGKHYVDQG